MKNRILPAVAMAMCLAAAPSVSAQQAAQPADSLSIDNISLKQVEVMANRADIKTPVAFTNVTRAELLKANDGRDITYLLSATPSVVATSDAGSGIGYTSMRVRGSDATRINIMANGIPLNDGESSVVFWVNMPDLASSLRDVQIQRGAGTSVNGGGAFGASLNMITEAPAEDAYAEVSCAYGSYNTNRETLRVGSGLLGDHWSFDARISHMGSDGYIDRAKSKLWSYFGQAAYSSRNTNLRFIAFGGYEQTYMAWDYASKDEMEQYGRRFNPCGVIYQVNEYGELPRNEKGKKIKNIIGYYPDQNDNFTQHHFQLHLSQRLDEKWHLSAALHYTDDYGYYEQFKAQRSLEEYGLQPVSFQDGHVSYTQDLVRLKFNDNSFGGGLFNLNYNSSRWNVTLGGALNYFHGDHFGKIQWVRNYTANLNPDRSYYDNTGKKLDGNFYARANFDISRTLSAFGDLQYRGIHYTINGPSDNFNWNTGAMEELDVDRTWHFFNPKVGLNYVNGAHRAFGSWSVAHKEPVRSNFTDGDHRHAPQAERLFDYELGYSFNSKIISAGINLYYMDYKDQLVVTGELSDTGNPLSVNVPKSYRMGMEVEASFRPWVKWFEWQVSATLSRNRIKDFVEVIYDDDYANPITFNRGDTPIAFSPDFIFNNVLHFTWRAFDASIQSQYISKQHMDNSGSDETMLDSYFVTNLHVNYTLPKFLGIKKMTVGASVYNIFSEKYCNNGYAGAGYYNDGTADVVYRYAGYAAQAPAHFAATLTLNF